MAIWISAIATGVIAIFAIINIWLILTIKLRDDEFRQQVSDLYRAIVVSDLVAAQGAAGMCSTMEGRMKLFKEYYKGKTTIFD